jgi:hypothetical protein
MPPVAQHNRAPREALTLRRAFSSLLLACMSSRSLVITSLRPVGTTTLSVFDVDASAAVSETESLIGSCVYVCVCVCVCDEGRCRRLYIVKQGHEKVTATFSARPCSLLVAACKKNKLQLLRNSNSHGNNSGFTCQVWCINKNVAVREIMKNNRSNNQSCVHGCDTIVALLASRCICLLQCRSFSGTRWYTGSFQRLERKARSQCLLHRCKPRVQNRTKATMPTLVLATLQIGNQHCERESVGGWVCAVGTIPIIGYLIARGCRQRNNHVTS